MEGIERFEGVLYGVPKNLREILRGLPPIIKANAEEIRLRVGSPLALTVGGESVFIEEGGQTSFIITKNLIKLTKKDIDESFKLICKSSVFAHQNELKNGFVAMDNGSRAGVCGTLNEKGAMSSVTSVNIRIAHEILGVAKEIADKYKRGGMLILGPPGSGKTTILRDLVRQLSGGVNSKSYRVAVIDSRGEISGGFGGNIGNDVGPNTDVLFTPDKAKGIEIAVRTMFPDIIAFDEIGTEEELRYVSESFCAGVDIITTAHIGKTADIMKRRITAELIKSGAIATVVILPTIKGGEFIFKDVKEFLKGVAV